MLNTIIVCLYSFKFYDKLNRTLQTQASNQSRKLTVDEVNLQLEIKMKAKKNSNKYKVTTVKKMYF
jgi:nitrogen fixation protein FixH